MKRIAKRKLLFLAFIIFTFAAVLTVTAFANEKAPESTAATLAIEAANLSFDDSVYVLYAVSHDGIEAYNVKMLFWTEAQDSLDEYTYGTESYSKSYIDDDESVNGKPCVIFKNNNLRAKNMADYVYARAYAVVDGVEYYSEVSKYSILQYAYNKLGFTGTASDNEALKNMLVSMLQYGADAQIYADHHTNRLANEQYYQINVEGGVLEDGFSKGLYHTDEYATLTAHEKEDFNFVGWQNSAGKIVSTDNPLELTDFDKNETYTAVYEEEIKYSNGLEYTLSEDKTYYAVSGIGDCTDIDIVIPPTHESLPVKAIHKNAFYDCDNLISVIIPDSVTSIGDSAFKYCSGLIKVTIGKGVASVGYGAFYDCFRLKEVHISDIASWCNISFGDCWANPLGNIADLYVNDELITELIIPDVVKAINSSAFYHCTSLTNVIIGNSVTSIGDEAFSCCTSLTSVIIGKNVAFIGDYAFYSCYKLVEVYNLSELYIKKGHSYNGYIGEYARSIYTSLDTPSKQMVTDDGYIFYEEDECYLLGYIGDATELTLPENCRGMDYDIYKYAFHENEKITKVTIPDSVTSIGEWAFHGCWRLTNITIPDSVEFIGYDAFSLCENLIYNSYDNAYYLGNEENPYVALIKATMPDITSCTIHKDTKVVYNEAFYFCSSLIDVTMPDSVVSIGSYAFAYCSNLESITIPYSVTFIGYGAFDGCTSLMSVTFENPDGWWYSSGADDDAVNGTYIDGLSDGTTAAEYLKDTYCYYYWKND